MEASGRDGVNLTLLSEQNSTHKLETGHILIKWSKFEVIRGQICIWKTTSIDQ